MKPGTNGRRPRGRPNRKQHGGHSRPNNFDSSGPEGRVRGNAHQVYERYIAMARDAVSASDRVAAETYFQYAEHYFRVLNASTDPQQNGQARQGGENRQNDGRQNDDRPNDSRQNDNRRNDNRQDRGRNDGRNDGQRTNEAQNRAPSGTGEQPTIPAANGQDAPPPQQQPAEAEAQRRQPRRRAPVEKAVSSNAASSNAASTNGAEPAPKEPDAQPEPKPDGDCKPANV